MPSGGRADGAMFFSYEVGPAHIISLACFYPGGFGASSPLTQFLKADLAAVDRSVTPWVVGLVHKDFTMQADAYADFSPILEAGGVDVLFCGHVHHCEK